jgi:hypothetical protein
MGKYIFQCPTCDAKHSRGFVNGVDSFRCLHCGYVGHGFHTDAAIDAEIYTQHLQANAFNRAHGIPERPMGVQP